MRRGVELAHCVLEVNYSPGVARTVRDRQLPPAGSAATARHQRSRTGGRRFPGLTASIDLHRVTVEWAEPGPWNQALIITGATLRDRTRITGDIDDHRTPSSPHRLRAIGWTLVAATTVTATVLVTMLRCFEIGGAWSAEPLRKIRGGCGKLTGRAAPPGGRGAETLGSLGPEREQGIGT